MVKRYCMRVMPVNLPIATRWSTPLARQAVSPASFLSVWLMRSHMDQRAESSLVAICGKPLIGNATGVAPLGIYGVTSIIMERSGVCCNSMGILPHPVGWVSVSTSFPTMKEWAISILVRLLEKIYAATPITRISMHASCQVMGNAWFIMQEQSFTCSIPILKVCGT